MKIKKTMLIMSLCFVPLVIGCGVNNGPTVDDNDPNKPVEPEVNPNPDNNEDSNKPFNPTLNEEDVYKPINFSNEKLKPITLKDFESHYDAFKSFINKFDNDLTTYTHESNYDEFRNYKVDSDYISTYDAKLDLGSVFKHSITKNQNEKESITDVVTNFSFDDGNYKIVYSMFWPNPNSRIAYSKNDKRADFRNDLFDLNCDSIEILEKRNFHKGFETDRDRREVYSYKYYEVNNEGKIYYLLRCDNLIPIYDPNKVFNKYYYSCSEFRFSETNLPTFNRADNYYETDEVINESNLEKFDSLKPKTSKTRNIRFKEVFLDRYYPTKDYMEGISKNANYSLAKPEFRFRLKNFKTNILFSDFYDSVFKLGTIQFAFYKDEAHKELVYKTNDSTSTTKTYFDEILYGEVISKKDNYIIEFYVDEYEYEANQTDFRPYFVGVLHNSSLSFGSNIKKAYVNGIEVDLSKDILFDYLTVNEVVKIL